MVVSDSITVFVNLEEQVVFLVVPKNFQSGIERCHVVFQGFLFGFIEKVADFLLDIRSVIRNLFYGDEIPVRFGYDYYNWYEPREIDGFFVHPAEHAKQ